MKTIKISNVYVIPYCLRTCNEHYIFNRNAAPIYSAFVCQCECARVGYKFKCKLVPYLRISKFRKKTKFGES